MDDHDYGRFIVLEGIDGAGTSTQAEKIHDEYGGYLTQQPGSDRFKDGVRDLISSDGSSAETQAIAFAADRMDHMESEIIPALKDGKDVICDRYTLSSLAYQTQGTTDEDRVDEDWVHQMNQYAIEPDITILIDVAPETGMDRIEDRDDERDIYENLDFQEQVAVKYRELVEEAQESGDHYFIVEGEQDPDNVFSEIQDLLDDSNLDHYPSVQSMEERGEL